MAVDRGGLQYTIEARDKFSATTQSFQREMRASKRAFRDFQTSLKLDRQATQQLRELRDTSRAAAQATKRLSSATKEQGRATEAVDRFEKKRLRTLRNLRDQVRLSADEEVRGARDARKTAAQVERQASAYQKKQQALKDATRAAKEAERAEKRLQQLRERQARTDRVAGERGQEQARRRELAALRSNIEQRAKAEQDAAREAERVETDRLRRFQDNQRTAERLAAQQRRAQSQERKETERAEKAKKRVQDRIQRVRDNNDPRILAQREINRGLLTEQVRVEKINQLRSRALKQFKDRDFAGGARTLQQSRALETSTEGTARNARNIFFSFRRLIGILAVFTLARQAVQSFTQLVGLGLRFGDTLESAQTSIAGIVLATGQLRDEFGETVEGAEALARAEQIAGKQIRALRQDALATTATFEQLIDTFQIAVGPGLAAGLDLDEIRQLSVDVSQAATAIGVPQNQLAEEIRSLLSGTIQARTTRIATVLGISNADIRRLQETGELFDFLDERFSSFADSAQKQARETLTGIRALVQGALGEVLGQAAAPLRDELISTLNDILDDVLLIRDELDNVAPRPEVVQAFRSVFDALRVGVERARELGDSLGFEGLEDLLESLGAGLLASIEFVTGFAETLLATFGAIKSVADSISDALNLTTRDLGRISGVLGVILGSMFLWNNSAALLGIQFTKVLSVVGRILPKLLRFVGVLTVIEGGVRLLIRQFTGLDVSVGDTIKAMGLSFLEVFGTVLRQGSIFAKTLANRIVQFLTDPIGFIASQFADLFGIIGGGAAALESFGIISEDTRIAVEDTLAGLEEVARDRGRSSGFQLFSEDSLAQDRKDLDDFLSESQRKFNDLEAEISGRDEDSGLSGSVLGVGDAAKEAAVGVDDFFGVLSTANQPIRELAESLVKLQDELRDAQVEFQALDGRTGLGGAAGNVARLFTQADVQNAERLRKLQTELGKTRQQILDLDILEFEQGRLTQEQYATRISLLRDELDLSEASELALNEQLKVAQQRAAIIAREELPGLREESSVLAANAAAQERIAAAATVFLGRRQQELIAAQQALAVAEEEERIAQQRRDNEIAFLSRTAENATGQEQQELEMLVTALQDRADLEERIAAARLQQLSLAQQEADLIANGTFTEGLQEGFNDILENLPTMFEAGVAVIQGSVQQLSSFISDSIVSAFDPTDDTSLKERFGRFLQSIAQLVISTIVQMMVVTAIAKAFGVPLPGGGGGAGAVPVTIPFSAAGGAADGGLVPGYAKGGRVSRERARPGLARRTPGWRGFSLGGHAGARDPRDTVPAFLQPGEFVVRKSVVDSMGMGFFEAVNNGNFTPSAAPIAAPSGERAASAGMRAGGLVSDRVQQVETEAQGGSQGGTVLPVMAANDREIDQLMAGGSNAFLAYAAERAGDLNAILEKERR